MIYVTGDTHGEYSRLSVNTLKNLAEGDTLIICGDFGFIWNGSESERKLLAELGERPYNIYFLDGTHENFNMLEKFPVIENCGGRMQRISGNLCRLMRGEIYTIEGKSIFVMGGGESPDAGIRIAQEEYSVMEIPTSEQLLFGAENIASHGQTVDYIITHEPPAKTKIFLNMKLNSELQLTILNRYFDKIASGCTFKKWYFGSMHADKVVSSSQFSVFEKIRELESGNILSR